MPMPVLRPNKPLRLPSWNKSRGHNATAIIPTSISLNEEHLSNANLPMLERLDETDIPTIRSDRQPDKA
jgi:hypothetical protein